MAWFSIRSLVTIVPAFVLGLAVGWWWWRRRKVRFGESEAISQLIANHRTRTDELTSALARTDDALRRQDEQLARLRVAVEHAAAAAGTHGVSSGSATWRSGGSTADDGAAAETPTPALVTEPAEPSPETLAALATPVEDLRTEEHQVPAPVPESLVQTPAAGVPVLAPAAEADRSEAADADGGSPDASEPDASEPDASEPDASEPDASEPDASEPDDLERVEGIGPRIGTALRGAGIHTFAELAAADIATLQGALEKAGLRFAPSLPTWSRQAALLADGDEEGFQRLAQQLVGGRDAFGAK